MHFIVFHYVIVCFIAFHLFSLAVGGGMAPGTPFFWGCSMDRMKPTLLSATTLPSSPLPTDKNQVPNKAEVFSALR